MCLKLTKSLEIWLNELRTNCEDYDFSLYVDRINNYADMNSDDLSNYQNIWECTSVNETVPCQLNYANECRVSTVFEENAEEFQVTPTMLVNSDIYNIPNDVLDWTTKLLYEYCSEDDDYTVSNFSNLINSHFKKRFTFKIQGPKGLRLN